MSWQCQRCGATWADRPVGDCFQCDLRAPYSAAVPATSVAKVPALAGCGTLLELGDNLVTRCGARPSSRGGSTVTLCPSCFSKLPQGVVAAKVTS